MNAINAVHVVSKSRPALVQASLRLVSPSLGHCQASFSAPSCHLPAPPTHSVPLPCGICRRQFHPNGSDAMKAAKDKFFAEAPAQVRPRARPLARAHTQPRASAQSPLLPARLGCPHCPCINHALSPVAHDPLGPSPSPPSPARLDECASR